MNQVDVEILGQVITHQYGTLSTGDILRTSPEFAKHLVDDCGAAKYVKAPVAKAEPPPGAEAPVAEPAPPVVAAAPAAEPAKPKKKK